MALEFEYYSSLTLLVLCLYGKEKIDNCGMHLNINSMFHRQNLGSSTVASVVSFSRPLMSCVHPSISLNLIVDHSFDPLGKLDLMAAEIALPWLKTRVIRPAEPCIVFVLEMNYGKSLRDLELMEVKDGHVDHHTEPFFFFLFLQRKKRKINSINRVRIHLFTSSSSSSSVMIRSSITILRVP